VQSIVEFLKVPFCYFVSIDLYKPAKEKCIMPTLTMHEIRRLPVTQRIILAERIWDSIPAGSNSITLDKSQNEELVRRLNRVAEGKATYTTWPEIRDKIRAKRSCK
jgi:putative addiction module component (TIGR02574 family)